MQIDVYTDIQTDRNISKYRQIDMIIRHLMPCVLIREEKNTNKTTNITLEHMTKYARDKLYKKNK